MLLFVICIVLPKMHSIPPPFLNISETFYFFQRLHMIFVGGLVATPSNIFDGVFPKIANGSKSITIA